MPLPTDMAGTAGGADHIDNQLTFEERVERDKAFNRDALHAIGRGDAVDLEVFRGRLGVALEPTSWVELRALLAAGPEGIARLGRQPLELKRYYDYLDQVIKREFASVTDYLYAKVFGLPTEEGADGRQVAVVPRDFNDSLQVVWRPNDFPYFFEPGMEHHNLWANRPLAEDELQQAIAEQRRGWETLHYINPPVVMSVPAIWHAHVISRPQLQRSQQRQEGQQQAAATATAAATAAAAASDATCTQ